MVGSSWRRLGGGSRLWFLSFWVSQFCDYPRPRPCPLEIIQVEPNPTLKYFSDRPSGGSPWHMLEGNPSFRFVRSWELRQKRASSLRGREKERAPQPNGPKMAGLGCRFDTVVSLTPFLSQTQEWIPSGGAPVALGPPLVQGERGMEGDVLHTKVD